MTWMKVKAGCRRVRSLYQLPRRVSQRTQRTSVTLQNTALCLIWLELLQRDDIQIEIKRRKSSEFRQGWD